MQVLLLAVKAGDVDGVKLLLESGARTDIQFPPQVRPGRGRGRERGRELGREIDGPSPLVGETLVQTIFWAPCVWTGFALQKCRLTFQAPRPGPVSPPFLEGEDPGGWREGPLGLWWASVRP